jgi:hypothetical protein
MGRASRGPMRHLPPLIAMLAMTGMEWDVLCNPFSPLQIRHWVQPPGPDEAEANSPAISQDRVSAAKDAVEKGASPDGKHPDRAKSRSKLRRPPEMHDLVAVRSKPRLSAHPLSSLGSSPVLPLDVVLPGCGSERHLHHPLCDSLLHGLCRLVC